VKLIHLVDLVVQVRKIQEFDPEQVLEDWVVVEVRYFHHLAGVMAGLVVLIEAVLVHFHLALESSD
jgi:hypothetical protein